MRLLIIDNYDSFTYNLVHYTEPYVEELIVVRNDEIDIDAVNDYDAIILSPGPGVTADTGISREVVRRYYKQKKILGVCMGMQVIAEVFGGKLRNLDEPLHGVAVKTYQTDVVDILFNGIPKVFYSGRYHSWVIDEKTLPDEFDITAKDEFGLIQAIKHKNFSLSAVQFHPESILTDYGKLMIQNWVNS